jgi:uroporphyrinogen decarboxylase
MKRQPDFTQFLKVLTRQGRPDRLPGYEHVASPEFIERWLGRRLRSGVEWWEDLVEFWLSLGFDCIPLEVPLKCPLAEAQTGGHGFGSEARVVIRDWRDFEKYPWPTEAAPLNFAPFERVARLLPDGVKIVGGVCMGPYEWVSLMMGTEGLSFALVDEPELVTAVFERIGRLIVSADRQLATMEAVGALRQGDDLGFKTSTFLKPEDLRRLVFPIYRQMTGLAHAAGKPFILHSCGQLGAVYDDLIDYCRIDAKHSFEETILPVEEFKRQYGHRVTPLGGLDVDMICRGTPEQIRAYTRRKIELCFADGHWALGTGNSLTDYMPCENYRIVLEERENIK